MIKLIKTESEYSDALQRVYDLIQERVDPNTSKGDELELLTLLIEHYEEKNYVINGPSPIDAIKFRLDQLGKPESELANILGARSRQSEILSGKRKLSLSMIRKLNEVLGIPAQILIGAY